MAVISHITLGTNGVFDCAIRDGLRWSLRPARAQPSTSMSVCGRLNQACEG